MEADAGTRDQTTIGDLAFLLTLPLEDKDTLPDPETGMAVTDWLPPLPRVTGAAQHQRHTDVSQDPRYETYPNTDSECTDAPSRIPSWILPDVTQYSLHKAGYGTAPDLIYARGIPDSPRPDPNTFDRKKCNLVVIEVGFCRDLGCDKARQEKTEKNAPLVTTL